MDTRQRRKPRVGPKVVHRHRMGERTFRRVSELVFVNGRPRALLGWINLAGIRTPLYICELDPAKLHRSPRHNVFYYDGTTIDPRFVELGPDGEDDRQGAQA